MIAILFSLYSSTFSVPPPEKNKLKLFDEKTKKIQMFVLLGWTFWLWNTTTDPFLHTREPTRFHMSKFNRAIWMEHHVIHSKYTQLWKNYMQSRPPLNTIHLHKNWQKYCGICWCRYHCFWKWKSVYCNHKYKCPLMQKLLSLLIQQLQWHLDYTCCHFIKIR